MKKVNIIKVLDDGNLMEVKKRKICLRIRVEFIYNVWDAKEIYNASVPIMNTLTYIVTQDSVCVT